VEEMRNRRIQVASLSRLFELRCVSWVEKRENDFHVYYMLVKYGSRET
jgi:hypothetical protein